MPVELERKLEGEADRKGFTGKRKDAYVYGTMRKTGWKPQREVHSKAAKHLLRKRAGR